MNILYTADNQRYRRMTTDELRASYLLESLFSEHKIDLIYTDVDRAVIGSAVPTTTPLALPTHKELAANYFCERRELGVINVGEAGVVTVDGKEYVMSNRDSLYVARGSKEVLFTSNDPAAPAKFYLMSYPAHRVTETIHVPKQNATKMELGSPQESNERTIYQTIRPGIVDSCQLVMGITELKVGSVWNTKPPHTHKRRTEIYMYFDLSDDNRVFHFMGEPDETRSIVMKNNDVAVSPSWSIHSGVGTSNYSFVWAMGGENQEFDDMDHLEISQIR